VDSQADAAWAWRGGLIGLALVLLLTAWGTSPPAPRAASADTRVFSAERAVETLGRVLGEVRPHPVGSGANTAVRERLLTELRALGFEPDVQADVACSERGLCAPVRNVLARRAGREDGPALLLMAHYDSVGAGPGVADDGAGVAALLETGRVLAGAEPLRHPVWLLFTDGEEPGLLGARAFLERHPLAHRVGAVVNVEARGTAGASLLFETSGAAGGWLVHQVASGPARLLTNSAFASIYDWLPNDTDLSPFKRRGIPGLNLAFIGEPRRYHTARDNLVHLDRGSLQQQGDNLLAIARRLGEVPLVAASTRRYVFFDIFSLAIVRWPEAWTAWMAVAALTALALLPRLRWRENGPWRGTAWGALGVLLAPIAAALCQGAVLVLWRATRPAARQWLVADAGVVWSTWACGFLGAVLVAVVVRGRTTASQHVRGMWLAWALAGSWLAFFLPSAAYLLLVPTLVAVVALLLSARHIPAIAPVLAAGCVLLPLAWLSYDALGLPFTPVVSALVALVGYGLTPFLGAQTSGKRLLAWALGPALGGALLVAVWPADAPDRPQGLRILHLEDTDARSASYLAVPESGEVPAGLRRVAAFNVRSERTWAGPYRLQAFSAPASAARLPAPRLDLVSAEATGTRRTLRLRATSARGAYALGLTWPAALPVEGVTLAGRRVPEPSARTHFELRRVVYLALPSDGVEIELVLGTTAPVELTVSDVSLGLPDAAQALQAARPETAAAIHDGDLTLATRRVKL
jgi:hypothetical protein